MEQPGSLELAEGPLQVTLFQQTDAHKVHGLGPGWAGRLLVVLGFPEQADGCLATFLDLLVGRRMARTVLHDADFTKECLAA